MRARNLVNLKSRRTVCHDLARLKDFGLKKLFLIFVGVGTGTSKFRLRVGRWEATAS